jgi:hypothetical protein
MSCKCEKPQHASDPRHVDHCVRCSKLIVEEDWAPSIANLGDFFERLAEGSFPAYGRTLKREVIPRWFFSLYRECEGRMKAGNKMPDYKYRYLARSNPLEAQEEACDLVNYLFLETLRRRRLGQDEEADVALTGAKHAALAYEAAYLMQNHTHKTFSEAETN